MKKILEIDPSVEPRWDAFIQGRSDGSLYHHSLWKETIATSFGYQPIYLLLENPDHTIAGAGAFFLVQSSLTGTRIVSLPFSDHCDILADTREDFDRLILAIAQKCDEFNAPFVEFKVKNESFFRESRLEKSSYFSNYFISLEKPLDEIYQQCHRSCIRQCIQKALKGPLKFSTENSEEALKQFYALHIQTRKRHGLPPLPYSFFQNILRTLDKTKICSLLMVRLESQPVAGLIIANYGDCMYALYNASKKRYQHLHPNHLLFWKAIEMAKQRNFSRFDFGRTAANHTSLVDFKKRWGCCEFTIASYYHGIVKKKSTLVNRGWAKHTMASMILRLMPNPLLQLVSNTLYKHLG